MLSSYQVLLKSINVNITGCMKNVNRYSTENLFTQICTGLGRTKGGGKSPRRVAAHNPRLKGSPATRSQVTTGITPFRALKTTGRKRDTPKWSAPQRLPSNRGKSYPPSCQGRPCQRQCSRVLPGSPSSGPNRESHKGQRQCGSVLPGSPSNGRVAQNPGRWRPGNSNLLGNPDNQTSPQHWRQDQAGWENPTGTPRQSKGRRMESSS